MQVKFVENDAESQENPPIRTAVRWIMAQSITQRNGLGISREKIYYRSITIHLQIAKMLHFKFYKGKSLEPDIPMTFVKHISVSMLRHSLQIN